MIKKAVCLLSGGLDSTVTAFTAKNDGFDIYALTINYQQRHEKEIIQAKAIAEDLAVKKHMIFPLHLYEFGGSALLKREPNNIPKNVPLQAIGTSIPSTYVPARNTIFLSLALAYAETINADRIYIGVTAAYYSGYPDCRPEFIKAFQQVINHATKKTIQGSSINLHTPLINLSKKEIILKGKELDVPFEKTWSCYQGRNRACGTCESCQLRLKGFIEAGFDDPLPYESYPIWYKKPSL